MRVRDLVADVDDRLFDRVPGSSAHDCDGPRVDVDVYISDAGHRSDRLLDGLLAMVARDGRHNEDSSHGFTSQ